MPDRKDKVVFLRGKKVILRPLRKSTDLESCVRWMNDPDTSQYLGIHRPMSDIAEGEWLDTIHKSDRDIVLAIETLDGVLIGSMGLHRISWKDRMATTGAVIGEAEYRNGGYGTDAKMVLLDYAFNTLNLHKICSSVFAFNERSLRYSLHCGYKIEGLKRREVFKNGRYWDVVLLGVFKNEWLPYWKRYQKTGKP